MYMYTVIVVDSPEWSWTLYCTNLELLLMQRGVQVIKTPENEVTWLVSSTLQVTTTINFHSEECEVSM